MKTAREILAPHAWETPRRYAGFFPIGDYCILTRHRDSDAATRSNWEVARQSFDVQPYDDGDSAYHARPAVYDWRAGHCMVGWVEYLMVRADADDDTLARAAAIVEKLEDYPILNEDHFSELEYTEACDAWTALGIGSRVDILRAAGVSIFAARRDDMPSDDTGYIMEQLR
jgi:hypothetical protein